LSRKGKNASKIVQSAYHKNACIELHFVKFEITKCSKNLEVTALALQHVPWQVWKASFTKNIVSYWYW